MKLTPDSKLLRWCQRLAIGLLLLAPFSVASVRFEMFHFAVGLGLFALACLGSLLVLVVLLIAMALKRYRGERIYALTSALATLPPVLVIAAVGSSAGDYPAIHDIATNWENPPEFIVGKLVRKDHHNTLDIKPDTVAIQLDAYPDIKTIESEMTTRQAFMVTEDTVDSMGWNVYNNDFRKGLIEASVTSSWFGFVDDIVVQVRRRPGGTFIELRSISRVGRGDLGANAARIRAFRDKFRELEQEAL